MAKRVKAENKAAKPKVEKSDVDITAVELVNDDKSVKMEDFDGEKILEDISNKFGNIDSELLLKNEELNNVFNEINKTEDIINNLNEGNLDETIVIVEEQLDKLNKINNELNKSGNIELNDTTAKVAKTIYDKKLRNSILSDFWNGVGNNGWI